MRAKRASYCVAKSAILRLRSGQAASRGSPGSFSGKNRPPQNDSGRKKYSRSHSKRFAGGNHGSLEEGGGGGFDWGGDGFVFEEEISSGRAGYGSRVGGGGVGVSGEV